MKEYMKAINKTRLFHNLNDDEILSMLSCIGGKIQTLQKDEYVIHIGEHLNTRYYYDTFIGTIMHSTRRLLG